MSYDSRPDDDFMGAKRSDEFTGPYFEISSDVKSKGGFLNEGSPYAYFGSKENHYNDKVVRCCNEESCRLESMDLEHRATFDTLEMVPKNKAAYAHFNSKENKYNGSVEGTSCWESVDLNHRVTTFETIVMVPENKGTYAYVNLKENKYNGSKEGRCCWESMDHWATLAMVSENKGAYVHFNSKENKYNGTKEGSCFWRSIDLNHRTTFQTLAMVKKSKGSCAYAKLKENRYNGSKEVTSCWESMDVDSGTCAYLKLKENKYNGSKEVTCCWESMDVDHRVTTVKTLVIVPGKKGTYVHFKLKENKINGTKEGSCCWESVDLEHRATTLETLAMIPESMGTYAYFNSKESKYNGSPALRRESKSILGLEDLQQHFGGRRDDAAKSFGAIYDPGIHTIDALARKSFKVVETLQTEEQPNDCVPILSSGTLAVEGCVQEEKSPDLPRVMQISRVEQRVRKLPTYLGGLTAQSASSSHWPIGLPDGRHIVLLDPLEQSTKNVAHGAKADKCSPIVSVPETKKVRKTWKRNCRTMNVVFEIQQQPFGRRCEGAAKKFRVTHICRKHGIKQVSAVKRYHDQHSIHQWPFHQKWATRKGYSLGDERPFEVSSLSVDEKLDSRLQCNHMCQFARSSPRPLAFPNGGEIIGPIALSSSEFVAANKRAHLVGQDQSSSTATHHEMKVTREMSDKKGLSKHKVALRRLGVNISMFKSTCRQNRVYWWACQIENNQQQSFHATNNRAHLVKAEMKNKREALKGDCITKNVHSLEDLEHYGCRHKDAAKGLGDSLARKSFEVLYVLPLLERSYSIRHLVPQRILAPKRWVRLKKSQDLPRTQQMNCSGGLTAIDLPEGGHILSLSKKKIVRKTLKRKCRSMSVLNLEDHKQHVDRRWEDVAKSHGVKRICRQLVIHCLSTAKRIRKQHGIHRWPFQRSAIGLPDGGHILPLSEKKIVRKTLKRKCRSMSVISLVDRQQHVDKRCEDAAKNIGVHAAKRICRQLVIHHVSKAKHRQHGIHHQWPFHQDWATMKGYSLGDERPVEVISLSTHVKLVSRLQLIYISWLGRFSPWPSALAGGGEIGGPIALSLSESAATKNIAQRVGQDQSGSAASDSKNERTREQEDPEEICTSITSDDLRRLSGRMNRKDAATSLGVSESTFKRKCREYGIKRWPHVRKDKVGRPPDQHGEGNTSTAHKTPSHNVQTGMEGEPVGQNHEANVFRVFRRDCMRGPIAWNTESRLITVSIPPDQHGERNTSTACETPSHNVETGMEVEPVGQNQEANVFRRDFTEGPTALNTENGLIIGSSSEWASQVKDQSTLSTPYPNHDALVFPQPQITSMLSENRGGSIDCRSSLASQAEPFSDRHISGSIWRSPDQLEGQTTQFTAHPNPNALVFPQSQIASTQVLNENEDGRNSLQLEAYFMGHVSESSNLAFSAYSDAAAPSQPVATILQTMPMTTHMIPQTGDFSVIFQLEGQLTQSTSHPNLNVVVPPEPQIASTQILSENMGSQENWEFLSLEEELPLGGHVSGSVNLTVTTCDPSPSQQPMPTNHGMIPAAHVMSHLIAREDMRSVMLKVSYGHKTIKFQVPLTSRIIELKEEVKKRLKLEPSSFDFEYKDEDDGEWIFLGCDEDLTNHLQLFSNQVIRLLVVDSDASTKDICESCGSLKRKRQ